jgi:hypothetical protein
MLAVLLRAEGQFLGQVLGVQSAFDPPQVVRHGGVGGLRPGVRRGLRVIRSWRLTSGGAAAWARSPSSSGP